VNISFTKQGWEDLAYWIENDRKMKAKIMRLVTDCARHPEKGLGQPEPLKPDGTGWWSRRIDQEHRLVYRVVERDQETVLEIAQCRGHY